jgi:hypothetical protein
VAASHRIAAARIICGNMTACDPYRPLVPFGKNPHGRREYSLNSGDRAENATRFGCGFLFGIIFGGEAVKEAIRRDIQINPVSPGHNLPRTVRVGGQEFRYGVHRLPNGTINVGRITPPGE